MLLGVSRQSVTKWEAEKSYPEMDKLIKMCQIFECSLDDLVQGDLTGRAPCRGPRRCQLALRPMSAATTSTCTHSPSAFLRVLLPLCSALWGSSYSRRGRPCAACSIAAWQQAGASFSGAWLSVRRRARGRRHLGFRRHGAFCLCEGPARSSRTSTRTRTGSRRAGCWCAGWSSASCSS